MKICFICHANICRSFMAQEFLKKIVSDNNRTDIEIISRGTYALPHFSVPKKIKDFLKKENIIYKQHISTLYSKEDLSSSNLIFVMTKEQLEEITDKYSQFSDKIHLFSKYSLNLDQDMQDPISKEGAAFEAIATNIKKTVIALYSKLPLK